MPAPQKRFNIRIINLSVASAVTESYNTDPLTLAAKHAVDAGIVLVTAPAGSAKGRLVFEGGASLSNVTGSLYVQALDANGVVPPGGSDMDRCPSVH